MPSECRYEDKWPDLEGGYTQIPNTFIQNIHRLPFIGTNRPRNQVNLLAALLVYIQATWNKGLEWKLADTVAAKRQGKSRKTTGMIKRELENFG